MATPLHEERLNTVTRHLVASSAQSVIDLGCGRGELLARLVSVAQFRRIVGIDISMASLAAARSLLGLGHNMDDGRLCLLQTSFAQADDRLRGFDAALLVETIEHIDPNRLSAVEHAVFSCYQPETVLVTTPNQEYNVLHGMRPGTFRHPDHRFEWGRAKFRGWAFGVSKRNGYSVVFGDIGEADPILGSSTQMATFRRHKNGERHNSSSAHLHTL
ncbi:MAG: methyltransferase domain-containing protein [Burkholderiaceae bacterium]|nr:methyltransferase domain-containing protein [Burkholderiaceae bacterium]